MTEEGVARADALKPLPVVRWARQNGFELLDYDPRVGNVHAFFWKTA